MTWALLYKAGGWSALLYGCSCWYRWCSSSPLPCRPPTAPRVGVRRRPRWCTGRAGVFVGLAVPALVVFTAVAVALKGVDKSIAAIGGLFGIASEVIEPPRVQWRVLCASSAVAGEGFWAA